MVLRIVGCFRARFAHRETAPPLTKQSSSGQVRGGPCFAAICVVNKKIKRAHHDDRP